MSFGVSLPSIQTPALLLIHQLTQASYSSEPQHPSLLNGTKNITQHGHLKITSVKYLVQSTPLLNISSLSPYFEDSHGS